MQMDGWMDDSVGLISRAYWKATCKEDLTLFLVPFLSRNVTTGKTTSGDESKGKGSYNPSALQFDVSFYSRKDKE